MCRPSVVAGRVADESGMSKPIAVDQRTEVLRLGQTGVSPALEISKAAAEPRHLEEHLDVTALAVADDEERITGAELSQAGFDVLEHRPAELSDGAVVFRRGGGDERENVRLGQTGEDLADALLVRLAGHAPDVVLGDGPEGDSVP